VKQYFITSAYTDNYRVVRLNSGKVEHEEIVAYYELEGYTSALESFGYRKAEYVPALEAEVKKAQESLDLAKKAIENAKKNPLKISVDDARRYGLIKDICDWGDD
jgi:hypothetical protein